MGDLTQDKTQERGPTPTQGRGIKGTRKIRGKKKAEVSKTKRARAKHEKGKK